jgi:hypothetical protein
VSFRVDPEEKAGIFGKKFLKIASNLRHLVNLTGIVQIAGYLELHSVTVPLAEPGYETIKDGNLAGAISPLNRFARDLNDHRLAFFRAVHR